MKITRDSLQQTVATMKQVAYHNFSHSVETEIKDAAKNQQTSVSIKRECVPYDWYMRLSREIREAGLTIADYTVNNEVVKGHYNLKLHVSWETYRRSVETQS